MTKTMAVSKEQIRNAYARILPRADDKRFMCERLLTSIGYCESIGSTAWSVSLLDRGFRLNVGLVEVLTCCYSFWDRSEFAARHDLGFLDFKFLISGPEADRLAKLFDPYLVQRMSYRSVTEDHWALHATLIVEGVTSADERAETIQLINDVQSAHRNFVVRAAHTSFGSLRKRSNFARFNCEALVTYAREEVGAIPDGNLVPSLKSIPTARPLEFDQISGGNVNA